MAPAAPIHTGACSREEPQPKFSPPITIGYSDFISPSLTNLQHEREHKELHIHGCGMTKRLVRCRLDMQLEGVHHCTFSCIALLAAQSRHSCQASRTHLSEYHDRVL